MAGIAGTLEYKLDPVGAEPRSHPRELGPERVAHSEEALPSRLLGADLAEPAPDFDSGFDSALGAALASGLAAVSDLPSAAAFSDSGFRGPLPSLP